MVKALHGLQSISLGITDRPIAPSEMRAFEAAVVRWTDLLSESNHCTVVALWQGESITQVFPADGPYPSVVFVKFARADEAADRDPSNRETELSTKQVAEQIGFTANYVSGVARKRGIGRMVGRTRWFTLDDLETVRRASGEPQRPRTRRF